MPGERHQPHHLLPLPASDNIEALAAAAYERVVSHIESRRLLEERTATEIEILLDQDDRLVGHPDGRDGAINEALVANLTEVEIQLERLRKRRQALEPQPVALPENLQELYRHYVENLVRTLSGEEVIGRASDELRRLIERVVVDHDAELGHMIEIFGDIARMLGAAANKKAAPGGAADLQSVCGCGGRIQRRTYHL